MAADEFTAVVLRRSVENARDIEDVAWKNAILELYTKTMAVMLRLGVWVGLVFVLQVAMALAIAWLVWRSLQHG
jgi:hypothetical protein